MTIQRSRRLLILALLWGSACATVLAPEPAPSPGLSAEEKRIVGYVDAHMEEAIALLQRLVDANSGTMNHAGVREVGAMLRKELDALEFETRWIDFLPETNRAGHLFAERTGSRGKRLLLIGHLDTVFEPDHPFQHWTRDGSTAHGPGVSDMKGGDVAIVFALRALQSVGALDDTTIRVAFTGDEERAGRPLSLVRGDLIAAAQNSDVALGFEGSVRVDGTDYGTIARRSSSRWTLRVTGRQGHSSRIFSEEAGAGAIFETARILNGFYEEVRGETHLSFNPGLLLGGTEVTLDQAQSRGTAFGKNNVVAQTVVVTGGLRTISDAQLERAREKMRGVVARSLPGTSAEISFADGYPAMSPEPANYALFEVYNAVNRDLGHGPMEILDPGRRGAADISFAAPHVEAALAGVGAYGAHSHSPEETMDLDLYPLAIQRAAVLIYRLTR